MLGLGVMINTLAGNDGTVKAIKQSLNKTIHEVKLEDNVLRFSFTDKTTLRLYDDGQSCCEYRYMSTDDDLSEYSGAKLIDFELKSVPDLEDGWDVHEVQFLDVKTDNGIFQIANHNEHNGYYGGFCVVAEC